MIDGDILHPKLRWLQGNRRVATWISTRGLPSSPAGGETERGVAKANLVSRMGCRSRHRLMPGPGNLPLGTACCEGAFRRLNTIVNKQPPSLVGSSWQLLTILSGGDGSGQAHW